MEAIMMMPPWAEAVVLGVGAYTTMRVTAHVATQALGKRKRGSASEEDDGRTSDGDLAPTPGRRSRRISGASPEVKAARSKDAESDDKVDDDDDDGEEEEEEEDVEDEEDEEDDDGASAVEDARSKARRQQEQRATKIVEESKSARKRRSGSR